MADKILYAVLHAMRDYPEKYAIRPDCYDHKDSLHKLIQSRTGKLISPETVYRRQREIFNALDELPAGSDIETLFYHLATE